MPPGKPKGMLAKVAERAATNPDYAAMIEQRAEATRAAAAEQKRSRDAQRNQDRRTRKRGQFLGEVLWHLIDLLKHNPITTNTRTA